MKAILSMLVMVLLAMGSTTSVAKGPQDKGPADQAYEKTDDNARFIRGENPPQGKGSEADTAKEMKAKRKTKKGDSKKDRAIMDKKAKEMSDTPRDPEKIRLQDKVQQKERARDRMHVQENKTPGEDANK